MSVFDLLGLDVKGLLVHQSIENHLMACGFWLHGLQKNKAVKLLTWEALDR